MARYIESAFNPEPEKFASRREAPLDRETRIEALMKGAEILVERNSPLVAKTKELMEGLKSSAQIPYDSCEEAVESYGYEPEMVYAIGKVLERAH